MLLDLCRKTVHCSEVNRALTVGFPGSKYAQKIVKLEVYMNFFSSIGQMLCCCCMTTYFHVQFIHSLIHSIGKCRMQRFLAFLRSFFHSSVLCTFSSHPSPPTILPSSLTSSCNLFLGLSLNLVVPKFIYNILLRILFSSILCISPNQRNLFNLIVSIIVGFLTLA